MNLQPAAATWLRSGPVRWIVSAPGRVNLIGEHVDYCGGFVLPAAVSLRTCIAADIRQGHTLHIETAGGLRAELTATERPVPGPEKWVNYLRGVLAGCLDAGLVVPALDVRIASALPQGGGLASSAALTVAFATLLEQAAGVSLDPGRKAGICQDAEAFAGVPSGCMDQIASVQARADHAMLIDCRSRELEHIPLCGAGLLIIDTGVRHDLADGGYATRRAETEEAARLLGVPALRDCSSEFLIKTRNSLTPLQFRRARHVVSEIHRTLECAAALRSADWPRAGELMNTSHESLSADFAVSCPELDFAADCARRLPGVFGCRMTGGGFGGCCVALVRPDALGAAVEHLRKSCLPELGPRAGVFVTSAADGAVDSP